MKVLFDQDFRAMRQGQFIKADEIAGEFFLDLHCLGGTTKALLINIAEMNGLKVDSKLRKEAYAVDLFEKLEKLNLPELNKMTLTENIQTIVSEGVAAGHEDEQILCTLMEKGGLKFKAAGQAFTSAMEAGGHRMSNKARYESVAELLDGAEFNPDEEYSQVESMVVKITEAVSDTSDKQALSAIKKWAKANEVVLPAKPKAASKASGPRSNLLGIVLAYVRDEHREATAGDIDAKIAELKPEMKEAQRAKYVSQAVTAVEYARAWSL